MLNQTCIFLTHGHDVNGTRLIACGGLVHANGPISDLNASILIRLSSKVNALIVEITSVHFEFS